MDFEHSLHAAINKLRGALGDSAEHSRYVETVPGHGYRFIGLLRTSALVSASQTPDLQETKVPSAQLVVARRTRSQWLTGSLLAAAVLIVFIIVWITLHASRNHPKLRVQQLTTNVAENSIWHSALSADGKYAAYGDLAGIQVRLISTGESHLLSRPASLSGGDAWFPAAWSPDGTRLFATSITASESSAWIVPLLGGNAILLRKNARVQSVSSDGSLVAFCGKQRNECRRERGEHSPGKE